MRKFAGIIEAQTPPPTNVIWLSDGDLKYFFNGEWVSMVISPKERDVFLKLYNMITEVKEDLEKEKKESRANDFKLFMDLKSETVRAKNTESKLQRELDKETERAKGREDSIEDALESEVTRATNEEERLEGEINDLKTKDSELEAKDNDLAGKIEQEKQRATAAENEINDQLDIITGEDTVDGSIKKALKDAKEYTKSEIESLIGTAPDTLDTLGEIADALNDDANLASTLTQQLSEKASKEELESAKKSLHNEVESAKTKAKEQADQALEDAKEYVDNNAVKQVKIGDSGTAKSPTSGLVSFTDNDIVKAIFGSAATVSHESTWSWGHSGGTGVALFHLGDGCDFGFKRRTPESNTSALLLDGTLYVKEGLHKVLDDSLGITIEQGTGESSYDKQENKLKIKVPDKLPNPHKLTIDGKEYDGSAEVTLKITELLTGSNAVIQATKEEINHGQSLGLKMFAAGSSLLKTEDDNTFDNIDDGQDFSIIQFDCAYDSIQIAGIGIKNHGYRLCYREDDENGKQPAKDNSFDKIPFKFLLDEKDLESIEARLKALEAKVGITK